MECLFGFVGNDYTLIAVDRSAARSIMVFKQDEDKIVKLDENKILGAVGESGDRTQLTEYFIRNMELNRLRTDLLPTVHASAHYIRNNMASFLRRSPYMVNLLLGGVDEAGPALYFIDYMGALVKQDFAIHGHGSMFLYSLMDRHWKRDMTEEEGLELTRMCIKAMHTRFLAHLPSFMVKIVRRDSCKVVEL